MLRVTLANDLSTYFQGKSDGIIFSNVSNQDLIILKRLAETYNKQIRINELKDVVTTNSSSTNLDIIENTGIDKRKIKKIFINNGKETIKITPDKLKEYLELGYKPGRKK